MLELLFLLLPIAAAYGWYMGHRSAKKDQDDVSNKLSRDYVTGVNFLLSNQTEKAVDLFLHMLQKQEQENDIEHNSLFDAELTLGNLFRSRGEVDRALRIHQSLANGEHYSFEQKLLAKQQLAIDFMAVGFFDRAENIYISLIDEPNFAENALQQLTIIYQKTKEWQKAINVAEKLALINPQEDNIELAQFYCEYAKVTEETDNKESLLLKALKVSPTCVRASLALGELYIRKQQYQSAVSILEKILTQNNRFISEALPLIKFCYEQMNEFEHYELFLIHASQQNNSAIDLALAEFIERNEGKIAAQNKIYQQLAQNPNLFLFRRFIQYQVDEAEQGRGRDSLVLLQRLVNSRIKQSFDYRCTNCGYQSHKLIWCCPSCRQWEQIKPTIGLEADV